MLESSNKFNHNYHIQTAIDTEAPLTSGGAHRQEAPKGPNKKRRTVIIAGIATAAVATVAIALPMILGHNSGDSSDRSQGEKPPKAIESSAPANPTNTEKATPTTGVEAPALTGEALIEAFTIPESLSGEALAKTFVQKIQDWGQYGENTITQEGHLVAGDKPDILETQAHTGGETIADALIASDKKDNYLMTEFVDTKISQNISITDAWTKTYYAKKSENPFPYVNKEPFNQTLEFNSVNIIDTDEATGAETMDISFTQHTDLKNLVDPTQESTINPDNSGFTQDNVPTTWRVAFVHEDGANKVASVIITTRK